MIRRHKPTQTLTGAALKLAQARDFMLAGKAILTLSSTETGKHYTYRIDRADAKDKEPQPELWFVNWMPGSDVDVYIGVLRRSKETGTIGFVSTKHSKLPSSAVQVQAIEFAVKRIMANRPHPKLEIRHEGRCGCCNRPLTNPKSIDIGIGPECLQKHKFTAEQVAA